LGECSGKKAPTAGEPRILSHSLARKPNSLFEIAKEEVAG
jgi:hypothetical protein